MRRIILVTLLLLAAGFYGAPAAVQAADSRSLVIVSSEDSPLERMSAEQLRRVFLLLPVDVGGIRPTPLRNESDEFLTEVFLQRVVFMSQSGYERQLVSRVFRFGGVRPLVYEDLDRLVEALRANPEAVAVMWDDQRRTYDGLKMLGELWAGSKP